MPADIVSFWLKPVGFFDRNPSLDVEPSAAHCAPGMEHAGHEHAGHDHAEHEHDAADTEPRRTA